VGEHLGKVGITINIIWPEPKDGDNVDDVEAAERSLQMKHGWFCNPIFGNGDYPDIMKAQLAKASKALGRDQSLLPEFSEEEKRYNRGKFVCQLDEEEKKKIPHRQQKVCCMAAYSLYCACRVTTCLENLEILGNLTAVREMSGILLKIREMSWKKILSGKSCLKLFIVNCIFVSIQVFSRILLCHKC